MSSRGTKYHYKGRILKQLKATRNKKKKEADKNGK